MGAFGTVLYMRIPSHWVHDTEEKKVPNECANMRIDLKTDCIKNYAILHKDASYCSGIDFQDQRNYCYYAMAFALNDSAPCYKMEDRYSVEYECKEYFAENMSVCKEIADAGQMHLAEECIDKILKFAPGSDCSILNGAGDSYSRQYFKPENYCASKKNEA